MSRVRKKRIRVKWNAEQFSVRVDSSMTSTDLKRLIHEKTHVPPATQKIFGVGDGELADGVPLRSVKISRCVQLIGSAEALDESHDEVVFAEDLVKDGDTMGEEYACGMKNLGNTCYLNAVVQVLNGVPELRKHAMEYQGDDVVLRALGATFRGLNDMSNIEFTPLAFVGAVRTQFPEFNKFEQSPLGPMYLQQDSSEFLNKVLNHVLPTALTDELFRGSFQVTQTPLGVEEADAAEMEVDFTETWTTLHCNIDESVSHVLYGLQNSLVSDVERGEAIMRKKSAIAELPRYLIVTYVRFFFKRLQQVQSKIVKAVKFEMIFDAFRLCTDELQSKIELRRRMIQGELEEDDEDLPPKEEIETYSPGYYQLFGLVTHKGRRATSGHYVGWVRQKNDKWLQYDDDTVTEMADEDEILKLAGGLSDYHITYMAFYRSRNDEGGEILHRALQS